MLDQINKKYKFENKYFEDPNLLKEKIINKTIIPHQVIPTRSSRKKNLLAVVPLLLW